VNIIEAVEREGFLEVRVEGLFSPNTIEDFIRSFASLILERKATRVLADALRVTGTPSTLDRYTFGTGLARIVPASVRLAMLARTEMADPQRLGSMVARNRGLAAEIFDDRDEAIQWLMEESGKPESRDV
jgi:hypothetical protein